MKNNIIVARNIGKQYRVGAKEQSYGSLRDIIMNIATMPFRRMKSVLRERSAFLSDEKVWALKDINFEVAKGEVLGLIGRNGAGKSTLLKILSRITTPTVGEIFIQGRIGSLLEVGTGFHPELTGRENVYLNGVILGMKRYEVEKKFDEIVAFAEIEKFVDTQVKHYSSGMYLRLAFAVAAHLEPEILLVDEVLAVGDVQFQKKCIQKMGEVSNEGRTVIFVSHNMGVIRTLCPKSILLQNGTIVKEGDTDDVVGEYIRINEKILSVPIADRTDRTGDGQVKFSEFFILDENQNPTPMGITGQGIYFGVKLNSIRSKKVLSVPLDVAIMVRDQYGNVITTLSSFFTNESPTDKVPDILLCRVDQLPLLAGSYQLDLWCASSRQTHDYLFNAVGFNVEQGNYFSMKDMGDLRLPVASRHGAIMIPQQWLVD